MSSPFPGMDPYLEGHLWTSFHHEFTSEIVRQLTPKLRPKYVALPERRYISGLPEDVRISAATLIPDVAVRQARPKSTSPGELGLLQAPVKLRSRRTISVPHFRILIRDVRSRRLVTAIELLSPSNKHGPGRKQYLRKRRRFLKSTAHLMEIDLHHEGTRVPMLDPYPPGAYFILLSRARRRGLTEVWPVAMHEPLPVVPVPLLKGDADVRLALQNVMNRVYEDGGLDLVVDYLELPDVELPADEAAWIDSRLREMGLRK